MRRSFAVSWLVMVVAISGCVDPESPEDAQDALESTPPTTADSVPQTMNDSPMNPDSAVELGTMVVAFTDVGQGDGIVVRFPDSVVVIDSGRNSAASNDGLTNYLHAQGVSVINHFVITHADADHSGGCDDVFAEFEVREFYHPGAPKDTITWQDCLDSASAEGSTTHTDLSDLDPGDYLPFSSVANVTLLHLDANASDANEGSITLRIQHGTNTAILVGDLTCDGEDTVLARFPASYLDADLLQVGHHGSRYSTCTPWLNAVTPAFAAISVGQNSYGHPHPDALQRLNNAGATTYTTLDHGTIEFTSNGTAWSIATQSAAPPNGPSSSPEPAKQLTITATVDEPEPCQYSMVSVNIHAQRPDGSSFPGATVTTTWNFKSSSPTETTTTNQDGYALESRSIGGASTGYTVVVDVEVDLGGQTGSTSTSFTPKTC